MIYTPVLHIDSTAAITWAGNSNEMRKAEYIEIQCHFVKDLAANGTLKLVNINLKDNIAKIFTEPLELFLSNKFQKLVEVRTISAPAKEKF